MDVITFGEAMLRLAPPNHRRLEQAYSLDVEIGGAELNTAVALTRMGRSAAWVSRLAANPLGRLIANRVNETGVAAHILHSDTDRVGVYFLEFGAAPRASSIVYDRADSAMARIQPGMIDWTAIFGGASFFYVTGITPALSESAAHATLEALAIAKAANITTCLDPNYRAKLWSVEHCRAWLQAAMQYVDVLVTNPEDVERFFGIAVADLGAAGAAMVNRFNLLALIMTLRKTPSVWHNTVSAVGFAGGRFVQARSYDVEVVDRLGSGDAFVAGLLHGLLDGDLDKGLEYGTAMSALKHTIPGDFAWITRDEVDALIAGGGLRISR
jgi:2-dehydro-3-deoxygluconokinase